MAKAKEINNKGYLNFEGRLASKEVETTTKSISKWVWKFYQGTGQAKAKNSGVMELEKTRLTSRERMQAGALYTAQVRRNKTWKKLKRAASTAELKINFKLNLRQVDISERSGLSLRTVQYYWRELLNFILKGANRGASGISRAVGLGVVQALKQIVGLLLDRRVQNFGLSSCNFSGFCGGGRELSEPELI
ncbi:hypothetical protein [Piscirickettsia litoralis]|uniref:Uncharacterized protein n=1 Tax=Piscirickettsia litoralis TaxID=1891921 RepID=A0ABX3A1I6_9GAMM|nr:hypothetical protein [Piscirickettsia litoralis]ODN41526.1 hypothetical protein BGC07_15575 [Piscirickettsia litoralis]